MDTERIIALHGARRGAAHIRTGAGGTAVTLSLRPHTGKGAPSVPIAACLADAAGRTVRVPLTDGSGRTAQAVDAAVVLLIARTGAGETFCAEGVRGALPQRQAQRLRSALWGLRDPGAVDVPAPQNAQPAQTPPERETAAQEARNRPAPAQALPAPPAPEQRTVADCTVADCTVAGQKPAVPPPQSEALRGILSRASELFPPGGTRSVEGHFASDEPLRTAFVPRPLGAQAGHGAGAEWRAAVQELSAPEDAPKARGVAAQEAELLSPFPEAFPAVQWRRVRYPGTRRFYLEGTGEHGGMRCLLHAVPGEAYPAQGYRSRGFNRFVRDVSGNGYWVRVQRLKP